jgi:multiple sugar transport system permease protein
VRAKSTTTRPTTAAATIKKYLTKEKLHKFIFGTREKQGAGQMIAIYLLLICIGFVYLYPVLYMVSTSFMNRDDLLDTSVKWLPSTFYLQNYIDAANSMDFWTSFLKGVLIAGAPTLCNIFICMMIGYGFARYDFKGKKIMMGILIFSYILPSQVTMIPTYVLYNKMGILGTLWTFILPSADFRMGEPAGLRRPASAAESNRRRRTTWGLGSCKIM